MSRVDELKAKLNRSLDSLVWRKPVDDDNHETNRNVRELVSILESDLASAKADLAKEKDDAKYYMELASQHRDQLDAKIAELEKDRDGLRAALRAERKTSEGT